MAHVRGHHEAARAFRQLAALVAGPGNQASKRALEPALAAAQQNVSESNDTGALQRSLVVKRDSKSAKTKPRYFVGPSKFYKSRGGRRPIKYAHLVEFGRAPNANGKGGYAGTRFLTRAFEATKAQAVEIFGRTIGPALEAQAAKLAARKARRS